MITDTIPYHVVPNDVHRHRLISISYIALLPCHGSGVTRLRESVPPNARAERLQRLELAPNLGQPPDGRHSQCVIDEKKNRKDAGGEPACTECYCTKLKCQLK